jgi:transposase
MFPCPTMPLGVSDDDVTKDRHYRTLDDLLQAQEPMENDLKEQFGTLFNIAYDLMLYDLTSTDFEGLAEENDLARRGYSRDHRSDCKQVVLALVVTREGFPLAHYTVAGNIPIGDILLETTAGQQLVLRRGARPDAEQKRILAALQLEIPQRLSPDRLL